MEIIKKTNKTYDDVMDKLSQFIGTEQYHKTTFNPYLLFTDGMKFLFDEYQAYWLGDLINSYFPNLMRDFNDNGDTFYIIDLTVTNKLLNGRFVISREVDEERKIIVEQNIGYIDLPEGEYQFFMIAEPKEDGKLSFVVLLPNEY